MLRVNLMVCRKCQQVFSLTAGIECPMCHSPLYMSVFVEEAAQQSVQADKCPACAGTGRSAMSDPAHECYACNGTGIRRKAMA
jgi:DnaJ-class molecular chaperone